MDTWWGKELPVEVRDGREVVERGVLENFIRERDRWLTKRDAARRLQIDKKSIDRLVRLGLLRSEARRPRGLTEIWIDSQSIEELLALLSGQVRRGTQGIPLRRAAALLSSYMLLVDILAEIVAGRLRIFSQTKPLSGLRDIQVSHEGVIALLRKQSLQRGEQDGVAKWIAARLLGVKDAMIEHWASIGSLRRLPNGRFSLTDVLAFRRRYQPCATLARKMGLPHQRVMSWVKLGLVRAVPGPKLQRVGPCWVSWKDVSITRSLMTVTAVAAKLKVTTSRVEWWVQTGQLTPFRHDTLGRPYFRTQDVALAPRTRPDLPRAVAADSLAQQLDCTSETVLRMLDQLGVRRGRWSNKVARHGASTLFRSMSSEQAARLLRVSDVAIRKWARTGQLQAHTGPTIDGAQYYRFVAHVVLKFADQLRQVQKQRGKRAPRQLWTPEEAAEYLHTDKSTVERLVHARLLTTIDGGFKPGDVRRLNPLPDLIGVITAVEAAEMLGVDRSSLDGYSKRMPVVSKIGTAKLYRLTDVTAWAELRGSSLTPPVAAQFLDVSRATVRELRLAGKLVPVSGPHIDGIGVYRFLITDLERVRSEFRPSRRPRGRLFDEAAAA